MAIRGLSCSLRVEEGICAKKEDIMIIHPHRLTVAVLPRTTSQLDTSFIKYMSPVVMDFGSMLVGIMWHLPTATLCKALCLNAEVLTEHVIIL